MTGSNLFLQCLKIENFKCFQDLTVNFCVPNGNAGSGLNMLIGENGHGKTSLLQAINFLTCGRYAAENKITINDFSDSTKPIKISASTSEFQCGSTIGFYKDWYFKGNGINFSAAPRATKQRGKLLSSPFEINNEFCIAEDTYYLNGQNKNKAIDSRDKAFSESQITNDGLNIFFFDRNRSRHLHEGTFKTTFGKICDDLNYKFLKKLNDDTTKRDEIAKNISGEYFKGVVEIAQKGTGSKVASELSAFFDNDQYKDLKIDLLNILHPFSDAFFAIRSDDDLRQILVRDLGSGVEVVLALLLLKSIAEADLTPSQKDHAMIYLIDEPELHLHPRALEKLGELLLEEAKTKQIFLTTHSPYLYKSLYKEGGVFVTKRAQDGKATVDKMDNGQGLFPWSPSWGEINFSAFDMPTIEFHNELYGHLQECSQKFSLAEFDNFLTSNGLQKTKQWAKLQNGVAQPSEAVTSSTYIRNSIHHPENRSNASFTHDELKESIKALINLTKQQGNTCP